MCRAGRHRATIAPPRKPRPHPQPEPEEESRTTGLITGIGISIVLAIAVIVGMYYFSGGKWTGKQQQKSSSVVATTTSSSPRTVTVTQDTPVQQAPQVPDNYTNNNQYEAPSQPTVQHNNQSTVGNPLIPTHLCTADANPNSGYYGSPNRSSHCCTTTSRHRADSTTGPG